jgi:hypothetical protein
MEDTVLEFLGFVLVCILALYMPRTILTIVGFSFLLGWWWFWVVCLAVVALVVDVVFLAACDAGPTPTKGTQYQ